MEYHDQIETFFRDREPWLTEAVTRLVSIDSVTGEPGPGMPFGEGPAQALKEALTIAEELGLNASSFDGYVGTVDLNGKETALHILCHLDEVRPGSGWTVTEPFSAAEKDGVLYGRGVSDDKGPSVAALLAMACVKSIKPDLNHNARLILGTDEECGGSDLAYYYAREPYAPCTFSPDAEFPVINVEKGRYAPEFSKTWEASEELPRLIYIRGGEQHNAVPADAEAVIEGISMPLLMSRAQVGIRITGAEYRLSPAGENRIRVTAHGHGCHASEPEKGINALTALMALMGVLPFAESESKEMLHFLLDMLPHKETTGKSLGIAMSDKESGPLTVALTTLDFTTTGVKGTLDCRTPLCADERNCRMRLEKTFGDRGFTCRGEMLPAHSTPADEPFVQTLLRCYSEYSGKEGECLSTGGNTYVHNIPNGVAFGAIPPDYDTSMHGPDEHIPVADLLTAAKIYAQAILELCI